MTADKGMKLIFDLSFPEIEKEMISLDEPKYRAQQIWYGLYKAYYDSPEYFTNLSLRLREALANRFSFQHLTPVIVQASRNCETQKTLFTLIDGLSIEAVLMRYRERNTLCVSTQAGCAMGCVFCATGQMGFRRHLTSGEIVEQVLYFSRLLSRLKERVTNITIMGMGEPFHNYTNTMDAIDRLNHPDGFALGARRFTISTVGLIPFIQQFTRENRQINLAISLHAAEDSLRSSLLPINRKYPLDKLISTCLDYVETTRRRLSFEWALIQGVNDSADQASKLALLLMPFIQNGITLCHVNVIPLNPTLQYAGSATQYSQAMVFKSILERHGIPCTIRTRRGIEIRAGCGQLATG